MTYIHHSLDTNLVRCSAATVSKVMHYQLNSTGRLVEFSCLAINGALLYKISPSQSKQHFILTPRSTCCGSYHYPLT